MYPTLVEIFGISISSFGFMVGLGVVIGTYVGERMFAEAKLPRDLPWSLAIVGFIGGAVGSKVWYIAERLARGETFSQLMENRAGLTWYGGLIIGLLSLWGYALYRRISFWTILHFISVPLLVAQFLGRIGCFFVGDDYGYPTDVPWAVAFPQGAPPIDVPVHPTMLYEAAWLGPMALVLWMRRHRSPFLFGEYLMVAGLGRFVVEFWRINPALIGSLSNAQVTSLALFSLGLTLWLYRSHSSGPVHTEASTGQSPA